MHGNIESLHRNVISIKIHCLSQQFNFGKCKNVRNTRQVCLACGFKGVSDALFDC